MVPTSAYEQDVQGDAAIFALILYVCLDIRNEWKLVPYVALSIKLFEVR